jgi:hypothetical protein
MRLCCVYRFVPFNQAIYKVTYLLCIATTYKIAQMCDLVADAGAPVADQRHLPLEHNVRSRSRCQNDDSNADAGGQRSQWTKDFFFYFFG